VKGMISAEPRVFICAVNFQKQMFTINSLQRKTKILLMLLQWTISVLRKNSEQVCKRSSEAQQRHCTATINSNKMNTKPSMGLPIPFDTKT
jgi:hypothetical protein